MRYSFTDPLPMSEPVRTTESSHKGTVTVTESSSHETSLGCDTIYLTSVQGLLKLTQMAFSFIAFMCVTCAPWWEYSHTSGYQFFQFVSMTCLVLTSIQLFLICTKLIFKIPLPWNIIAFGFFAFVAYAGGLYFAIMDYRRSQQLTENQPNTMSTTVTTTTTVIGSTVIETPPMQPEY
ncbi:CKLF-like MARVEL transmembrane domain-containing protein 4 isoform X3 [Antedon mediterranea]|uniref:CKLF-like MARVEL transmembrane domain-containing protein 4 isoform X3 n=1 Tax=Antedon mediterranea TaxID=105859 RepID=UPI003AF9F006